MEAKQQQVAVLHQVFPSFGVQAARLPDLGGEPYRIGETRHRWADKVAQDRNQGHASGFSQPQGAVRRPSRSTSLLKLGTN